MIEKINITGGEENIPVNNESYEWWNVGESVAFVMPPEDVLVTPVFKKVQDENDEYYVNLPVVGDKYINVPKGISTIKVYDDGGKDGNHSCKTFGNLYIYPPSGYSFIVSGTVTLPKWGRLNLYGDDKDNQIEIESSNDGQPISIGRHYFDAKDGFRIYFETDSKNAYAGLDMTITLFELNAPHEIRIASSDDGRVTSDCSTAKKGDTVTLTVHPDAQYVLEKMTITGGEDNTPVNNENYGWWNVGETATFVMPPEDVLVTPVFKKPEKMNGVLSAAFYDKNCLNYVMSKNGFMTGGDRINLTEEITEFVLYDEAEGYPGTNVQNRVMITCPPGYRLILNGTYGGHLAFYEKLSDLTKPDKVHTFGNLNPGVGVPIRILAGRTLGIDYMIPDNAPDLYGFAAHIQAVYTGLYGVSFAKTEHGSVEFYPYTMVRASQQGGITKGSRVVLLVDPEEGYDLTSLRAEYNGQFFNIEREPASGEGIYGFDMPEGDVTVYAGFAPHVDIPPIVIEWASDVIISQNGGGTVDCGSSSTYYQGDTVTLTVTTNEGYDFAGLRVVCCEEELPLTRTGENTWQFTMPYYDVYVYPAFREHMEAVVILPDPFEVEIRDVENGTLTADETQPKEGETVTLTAAADSGCELTALNVTTQDNGETVTAARTSFNTFTFVMPAENVFVDAVFTATLGDSLEGSGTSDRPYLIGSGEDWSALAGFVERGGGTAGLAFRLTENIEVKKMIGTPEAPFRGLLDGGYCTLQINLSTETEGCAPFRAVSGATIRNLRAEGAVSGWAGSAGLIGYAGGSNRIRNCVLSVSVEGTDEAASFVGRSMAGSVTTLENCLDLSRNGRPLGLGEGTVTAVNVLTVSPDQLETASGTWAGKGALARTVTGDGLLAPELLPESPGIVYGNTVYAAAGDKVRMTARMVNGKAISGIMLMSDAGETVTPLETDAEGVYAFTMPDEDIAAALAFRVSFVNTDDTVLQTGLYFCGVMPEYTGGEPVLPGEGNEGSFAGWSPEITPVTGDAVYTACYEVMPVISVGDNTVSVTEDETVNCLFTPQESGWYRFRSSGSGARLAVHILDGGSVVAWNNKNGIDLYNFDCLAELEAGKTYTAAVSSYAGTADVPVTVEKVIVHHVTLDADEGNGTVSCPALAWEGQALRIEAIPDEGYGAVITAADADGRELPLTDGAYYMPASDVCVTVRFVQKKTLVFETDPHIHFVRYGTNGMYGPGSEWAAAVPSDEVAVMFRCEEGYEFDRALVVAGNGAVVPCEFEFDENWHLYLVRFTMPEEYAVVSARETAVMGTFPGADFVLPEDLAEIGEAAFEGGGMRAVYIPDGCGVIGAGAFRNCTNLTAVSLPRDCVIREGAFTECPAVTLYSTPGSQAEIWCLTHANCTFVPIDR